MVGTTIFLRALPFNDVLIVTKGSKANRKNLPAGFSDEGKATDELVKWANSIELQAAHSPVAPEPVTRLENVAASESGNLGGTFPAGFYRVNVYREVVSEDPVSSGCDVTILWTHNGKSLSRALSAFSGAPQQDTDSASDVTMIEIDPNTTIGYQITYASNTPGLAEFQVTMLAELLQTLS